jgi:hypothetical protein
MIKYESFRIGAYEWEGVWALFLKKIERQLKFEHGNRKMCRKHEI